MKIILRHAILQLLKWKRTLSLSGTTTRKWRPARSRRTSPRGSPSNSCDLSPAPVVAADIEEEAHNFRTEGGLAGRIAGRILAGDLREAAKPT